jgi:hypothetical protein
MVPGLVHRDLVFRGDVTIFNVEDLAYVQISMKVLGRHYWIIPETKALIAHATPNGWYVKPETKLEIL